MIDEFYFLSQTETKNLGFLFDFFVVYFCRIEIKEL